MNIDTLSARAAIRIRRPPSEVFAAFADASAMSKFWFTRRDDGLKEGEYSSWFIGAGPDAISFDVLVKELSPPNRIAIEWESGGGPTQVTWTLEETGEGETILTIEEAGFSGSREATLAWALDSTAGFNQVIIAAKALIEHGVGLHLVADHA